MPDAIHGALLTCDNPPIKTFIEALNDSLPQEERFIVSANKTLDEKHLLIQRERVAFVQSKVKEFTDKNQYSAPRDAYVENDAWWGWAFAPGGFVLGPSILFALYILGTLIFDAVAKQMKTKEEEDE
ncbi:unnamed protein product [Bathycoccus prasinos]